MEDLFRCRINNVDHYQATPIADFDPPVPDIRAGFKGKGKNVPKVPIIRVFGATPTGQKVLMHIHGVFQYTYIEYSGSLQKEPVDVAIQTLRTSIDHALAVSFRQNPYDEKSSLVKGVPFYGYHVGYKSYLKIYLLNPSHMTRLADLFREGAIMKRVLQPYESHMQYIAQWMCDYNLYGCAYLDCDKVKFRSPVPDWLEISHLHPWHDQSIPSYMVSDPAIIPKQSYCALEVDVRAENIVNRWNIEARDIHHDFVERLQPVSANKKLVQSMRSLWKDETKRRKMRMGLVDLHSTPFPADVLISMSADPRNIDPGGWVHEEEFRNKLGQLAQEEHESAEAGVLNFDNFVKPVPLENEVQTALQSVEDLYSHNIEKLLNTETDHETPARSTQAVVDGALILGAGLADEAGNSNSFLETPLSKAVQSGTDSSSSVSNVMEPISSNEYTSFGIRQINDLSKLEDDSFKIPSDFLLSRKPKKSSLKRRGSSSKDGETPQPKKPRFIDDVVVDVDTKLPQYGFGLHDDGRADESAAPLGQVLVPIEQQDADMLQQFEAASKSPKKTSQQSTLRFAVVKDPNDLNTIKRLSQQSNSPEKKSIAQPEKTASKAPINSSVTPVKPLASSLGSKKNPESPAKSPGLICGLPRPKKSNILQVLATPPPTSSHVINSMRDNGLPDIIYQGAYYSLEKDVPAINREYAGKEFRFGSITVPYLPAFDPLGLSSDTTERQMSVTFDEGGEDLADRQRRQRCSYRHWSVAALPPSRAKVAKHFARHVNKGPNYNVQTTSRARKDLSQIQGPTQINGGFKYSLRQESTSVQHETQYMSVMSLEVHVNTRGTLAPNPEHDPITCIFWCFQSDDEDVVVNTDEAGTHAGILALAEENPMSRRISQIVPIDVEEEQSELELLTRMVDIVRQWDPDILTGYEVHNNSWGYLIERARLKYDLNFCDDISKMKSQSHGRFGKDEDRWGFNHTSTIRVTGRHTINIWRAMRGELNLLQYTMENVAFHLLHKRIPHYTFADLTKWYKSRNPKDLAKVIGYFSNRVQIDLQILEANELVPRTSEQARLIGVDWFSVISRGSQFKVENIMFRIAKPENFILVSPSRRQVGGQNALECLPLVMEPQSNFYTSPMLVFDFQSLYPSVMIAYNYCYSTFLGRVTNWRGTNKMGFTNYQRQERLLELLKDDINLAPNGIMYAKQHVRRSLLAKMLSEILETRVMVKSGMKEDRDDKTLQRLLNNRQLALKLIANVTYGYTSASFSGRMPCSEIADSIVQTGRETLERAIALIHSIERWGAEVVYGDTDSLFVYLKGRTREQAFAIGNEISKTVTDMNPRPIKLKFEKVYHPCMLLAKKRYVGFKYENVKQTKPEFEAKGIETVRRDGTPAEQKIEEVALKMLFRTSDLSRVKYFFQEQCRKIMQGRVSVQDFCFAREVRLGTYSDRGLPPPGALISARKMLEDPRLEPQYGERVPYVVVTGGPGARLIDRCVAPDVLLNDPQQQLDAEYYIGKNIIPPLERIFNLVGANVRQWYDEMPKVQRIRQVNVRGQELLPNGKTAKKSTLESYMRSSHCVVCHRTIDSVVPLCASCRSQPAHSLLVLQSKLTKAEKRKVDYDRICRSCSGFAWGEEVRCDSRDCPVFYSRVRAGTVKVNSTALLASVMEILDQDAQTGDGLEW
ncbi:DNA polymerase zeta [Lithohypha guttulata]|uniref:DNA polymerase n=1 Tax=Lithohypha guttulata TaxID=1690604 RepID=A0AAN7Y775_9EURO|nr:DNA polymerase zeta [Lithohypha guttulata]